MNNIMVGTILIIGCWLSSLTSVIGAVDLGRLGIWEDKSKTAVERVEIIYTLLREEVGNPSIEHRGYGGGIIDHDYVMAQIVGVLGRVARESTDAQKVLIDKIAIETNPEIKGAATIALAWSGNKTVKWGDILNILGLKDNLYLREKAVYALSEADPFISIPEFIILLQDPSVVESKKRGGGNTEDDYLIRRAAASMLNKKGISCKIANKIYYTVDRENAIKAIKLELSNSNVERATLAISAIQRIGGDPAIKALEEFIEMNATNLQKTETISVAKEKLKTMKNTLNENSSTNNPSSALP